MFEDKYTERVMMESRLGEAIASFCRHTKRERHFQARYEALYYKRKASGENRECGADTVPVITGRSLESHGEVYVNGEKVAVADLGEIRSYTNARVDRNMWSL